MQLGTSWGSVLVNSYNNNEFLQYLFGGDKLPHGDKESIAIGGIYQPVLFDSATKAYEYAAANGLEYFKPGLVDKEAHASAPVTKNKQGQPQKQVYDNQIRTITSLWADVDIGQKPNGKPYAPSLDIATAILSELDLPPNFIVRSGSGVHAYWRLTSPLWAQSHRDIVKRWQQYLYDEFGRHGYVIDRVGNVGRWMRIPGVVNKKAGKIVEWVINEGTAYTLMDFEDYIDVSESDGTQFIEDDSCKVVSGARPPDDLFVKLLEKPHVRALWERSTRRDSLSEYRIELANIAFWEGWESQDVANLLVQFEEENCYARKGGNPKLAAIQKDVASALRYTEENGAGQLLDTARAVIEVLEPISGSHDFASRALDILAGSNLTSVELSAADQDMVLNFIRKETGVKKSALETDLANKRKAVFAKSGGEKLASWLKEYNAKYAFCLSGDTLKGGVLYLDSGRIQSVKDFHDTRAPEKLESGDQKSLAWMENPHRPMVDNIVMDPSSLPGVNGSTYNMWRGFEREPNADGRCSLFWEYLYEALCSKNDTIFQYVKKWLAHMIQKPWEKPGTILVMSGPHGSGKSNLGKIMGNMIGQGLSTSFSSKYAFQETHDTTKARSLLVQIEEAFFAGDHGAHNVLKDFATSDYIKLNIKHGAIQDVRNYSRVLMTANREQVVGAEQGERRFVYLDVNSKGVDNRPYWDALFDQLNDGGYERLMWELCEEDLTGFSPMHNKPTDVGGNWYLRFRQWIDNSDHAAESWWMNCLLEGRIGTAAITLSDTPTFISNEDISTSCISYCLTHNRRVDPPRREVIGLRLKLYRASKKRMSNGVFGYDYKGLSAIREEFCSQYNLPEWRVFEERMVSK